MIGSDLLIYIHFPRSGKKRSKVTNLLAVDEYWLKCGELFPLNRGRGVCFGGVGVVEAASEGCVCF